MASANAQLRDEIYLRIDLKKTASGFVFNDFDIEKTWFPFKRLEALGTDHPNGNVYIIGMAPGDAEVKSRNNLAMREMSVMVGYQRASVDPSDLSAIDDYVELVEQLDATCIRDVDDELFSFVRLEYLKNENGMPYSFMGMREANIFEAYFRVFYNLVLQ